MVLLLSPGLADAEFALIFEDPATDHIDYRIADGDAMDLLDEVGMISVAIDDGTLTAVATATSKPNVGSSSSPTSASPSTIRALPTPWDL